MSVEKKFQHSERYDIRPLAGPADENLTLAIGQATCRVATDD